MEKTRPMPHIVLDTSYVVNDLNFKNFDGFLEKVIDLKNISEVRVKLLPQVLREINEFIHREKERPASTLEAHRLIRDMSLVDTADYDRKEMYRWFNRKSHDVGHRLGKEAGIFTISQVDRVICAYSLYEATNREVIIASRDRNLIDTVKYIERIARPTLKQRGYYFPSIRTAKDTEQLKEEISKLEYLTPYIKTAAALSI